MVSLSIDAMKTVDAVGRYVNDYRNIRKRPNAQFVLYTDGRNVKIGVFATEEIKKGEEICVTYGKGFWHARTIT